MFIKVVSLSSAWLGVLGLIRSRVFNSPEFISDFLSGADEERERIAGEGVDDCFISRKDLSCTLDGVRDI